MSSRKLLLGVVAALAIAPATAGAQVPSGTVVFQQALGIDVLTAGGTPTVLAQGEYPSISPNGQTVAYIGDISLTRGGMLTTIPVAGGTATQLTSASETVPAAWSPNGGQLTYLANGDLMLINASGGTAKRVVNGTTKVIPGASAFLSASKLIYLQGAPGGGVLPSYQVRTIGTNGSGAKTLKVSVPSPWKISGVSLSVSASKSTIAFSVRNGNSYAVAIAPTAGGKAKIVSGYYAADFGASGSQLCAQAGGLGGGALSIIGTTGTVVSSLGVSGSLCSWAS